MGERSIKCPLGDREEVGGDRAESDPVLLKGLSLSISVKGSFQEVVVVVVGGVKRRSVTLLQFNKRPLLSCTQKTTTTPQYIGKTGLRQRKAAPPPSPGPQAPISQSR